MRALSVPVSPCSPVKRCRAAARLIGAPMTMAQPRHLTPVGGGTGDGPASVMPGPTLVTERMVLRLPRLADAAPYMAVLMSDRARHIGGPMSDEDAWYDFCAEVAPWILHGYGSFAMEERRTGTFLGLIVLHHDFGDPEPELGWVITDAAEGKGLATEAAKAVRSWVFDTLEWPSIVSYVDPANARSARMCERLGAVLDPDAARPASYADCRVYRHLNTDPVRTTQSKEAPE